MYVAGGMGELPVCYTRGRIYIPETECFYCEIIEKGLVML